MPRRHHRQGLLKFARRTWESPEAAADWLTLLSFGGLLGWLIWAFGGWFEHGLGMQVGVVIGAIMLVAHAGWWLVASEEEHRLNLHGLLFLPALLFLAASAYFLSPAGWRGEQHAVLGLLGTGIFWFVLHGARTRERLWAVAGLIAAVAFFAWGVGMFQLFFRPDWLPFTPTLPNPDVSAPLTYPEPHLFYARGSFLGAGGLALALVLILPLCVATATMRRAPVPARILLGAFAIFFLFGLLLAVSWPGAIALGALAVLVPLAVYGSWRKRLQLLLYTLLGLGVLGGLSYWLNHEARLRFQQAWEVATSFDYAARADQAFTQFLLDPLLGVGAGAYPFVTGEPHAANAYLDVLASYGAIGAALFFLPVLYLLLRGLRTWFALPRVQLSPAEQQRVDEWNHRSHRSHSRHGSEGSEDEAPAREEKHRHRKRKRPSELRNLGRTPLAKLMLAGLLPALVVALVAGWWFSPWRAPVLVLMLAALLGLLVRVTSSRSVRLGGSIWVRMAGALGALLWAVALLLAGYGNFRAQQAYFLGNELLQQMVENSQIPKFDRAFIQITETHLQRAVNADPANAEAQAALALAIWQTYWYEPQERLDIVARALPHAEMAVELMPRYWVFQYILAEVKFLTDSPPAEIREAFVSALAMSQNEPLTEELTVRELRDRLRARYAALRERRRGP